MGRAQLAGVSVLQGEPSAQQELAGSVDRHAQVLQVGHPSGGQAPSGTLCWMGVGVQKAREFQNNIYSCFIDYDKDFNNKLWKILK